MKPDPGLAAGVAGEHKKPGSEHKDDTTEHKAKSAAPGGVSSAPATMTTENKAEGAEHKKQATVDKATPDQAAAVPTMSGPALPAIAITPGNLTPATPGGIGSKETAPADIVPAPLESKAKAAPATNPEIFLENICRQLRAYHHCAQRMNNLYAQQNMPESSDKKDKVNSDKKDEGNSDKKDEESKKSKEKQNPTKDQATIEQEMATLMQLNDALEHEAYRYIIADSATLFRRKAKASPAGEAQDSKDKPSAPKEIDIPGNKRTAIHDFLFELQYDHARIMLQLLKTSENAPYIVPGSVDYDRTSANALFKKISESFGKKDPGKKAKDPGKDTKDPVKETKDLIRKTKSSGPFIEVNMAPGSEAPSGELATFKVYVQAMFAKLLTRPEGRALVEQLSYYHDRNDQSIVIQLGDDAATSDSTDGGRHRAGGTGVITLAMKHLEPGYNNTALGKTGRIPFPAFLTLAHELVHLLRIWNGEANYKEYQSAESKKRFTNFEEQDTIDYENKIRKEHDLGHRISHAFDLRDEDESDVCCDFSCSDLKCIIQ
jgi:hypothetical protein